MASNKSFIVCLFFFFFTNLLIAQQNKYFIYFKDKNNNSYSLNNPSQYLSPRALLRRENHNIPLNSLDLPVAGAYLDSLSAKGAMVLYASKWLNGAMVLATSGAIDTINSLPFVLSYKKAAKKATSQSNATQSSSTLLNSQQALVTLSPSDYGPSYNQSVIIGAEKMHEDGFAGKGMMIAVLDDGFLSVDTHVAFDSLRSLGHIIATHDFVDNEVNVYDNGGHGTEVLSVLAGYSTGNLVGLAWQSDYLLLRSENDASETISEEYNWVRAAEYADSAGADIISSSLGYNTFDDPSSNHTYLDLDGKTTPIVKGAEIAAGKGILVVNAAGNEGNSGWKYILTPADGDSVLAVGAVDPAGNYASFSSIGPTADGRLKPDLVTQGTFVQLAKTSGNFGTGSGTSFATPAIAGLAAGIWQAFPEVSNMDIIYYLKKSANYFYHPDNFYGWGIPNYKRAKAIISKWESVVLYPNPIESGSITLKMPERELEKEAHLYFFDIRGQLLAEEIISFVDVDNVLKTNVTFWDKGIYFVKIMASTRDYTVKFLKF